MTEDFKVNDKRRVSAEGDITQAEQLKPEFQAEEVDISFSNFVISLATQAMMQMGAIPAPEGVELSVNKDAAKQTISILEMMKNKTDGNLDPQEHELLEDILHNLRLSFLRMN